MTAPAWLRARQAAAARTARLGLCRRCAAPILTGYDADIAALTVEVDPTPIGGPGEFIALATGRRTIDLIRQRTGPEIHYRSEWNIRAPRRWPVLAEHRCHAPMTAWAETGPGAENAPPARGTAGDLPDHPPF